VVFDIEAKTQENVVPQKHLHPTTTAAAAAALLTAPSKTGDAN